MIGVGQCKSRSRFEFELIDFGLISSNSTWPAIHRFQVERVCFVSFRLPIGNYIHILHSANSNSKRKCLHRRRWSNWIELGCWEAREFELKVEENLHCFFLFTFDPVCIANSRKDSMWVWFSKKFAPSKFVQFNWICYNSSSWKRRVFSTFVQLAS